jgi:site-specific DNA-methyltransferase (adenine-specific)
MLGLNKVYKMDCFNFLNKLENESVDLAIIDPPYNLKKADWDTFKSQKEFLDFTYKWIDELILKLKKTGSVYIFNTPFNSAYILQHLVEKKMIFQNWITWDKRDGMSASKNKYNNGQETILFFTKTKNYTFNYNDIRVPYESTNRMEHAEKKGILKNGKRWYPNPDGKLCGEVWHFTSQRHKSKINGKTQKMEHLTPKPLDMIERIVKASSKKGDIVIDFFVGSGTTAVASKKLKRNFICSDSNSNYVKLSNNFLKKYDSK